MKKLFFAIGVLCIVLISLTLSCESEQQKGERLSKKYCGSCHMFPAPSLLTKSIWEQSVLPDMRFRMGFDNYSAVSPGTMKAFQDQSIILKTIPKEPMVSEAEWLLIQKYYLDHAPDSLIIPELVKADTLEQFSATPISLYETPVPLNSLIKADTLRDRIYVGSQSSALFQLNSNFNIEDSFQLKSPAVEILFNESEKPWVVLIGMIDASDQPQGKIGSLDLQQHKFNTVIDSLKRPVFMEQVDLDNDNLKDIVVCAFGNYTGELAAYKNDGTGYNKYILSNLPGARKVIIRDFDGNGFMDILALMTQGDEQVILFSNQGDFDFKITVLLRFPPVYGSGFIDVTDFNGDGKFDILYSNGDNGDLSNILKPYHGVTIFLNDGMNHFEASWFYPLHGATQALARDFDGDGDVDIATIAFYADFHHAPERGFMYFENTGKSFEPYITPLASTGRWAAIESADIDNDGDLDILLGAVALEVGAPPAILVKWRKHRTSILVLKNNHN